MPRAHKHEVLLPLSPEQAFKLLVTPSHICGWWSAEYAIVIAGPGGSWTAAWGSDRDEPDYITAAAISEFEPSRTLQLSDYRYFNKDGPLPFEANFVTRFELEESEGGTRLTVIQSGFPDEPAADEFYSACEIGWRQTFEALREYAERL